MIAVLSARHGKAYFEHYEKSSPAAKHYAKNHRWIMALHNMETDKRTWIRFRLLFNDCAKDWQYKEVAEVMTRAVHFSLD